MPTPNTPPRILMKLGLKEELQQNLLLGGAQGFEKANLAGALETNRTFMIPMPPTIKTMLATAMSRAERVSAEAEAASILLPASERVKEAFG